MASKKIDLKKPLLDALNKPMDDDAGPAMLNELLSKIILRSNTSENTFKFFDWAIELANDGIINLDATDQETLQKFIEKNSQLTLLVKGRLLEAIKIA